MIQLRRSAATLFCICFYRHSIKAAFAKGFGKWVVHPASTHLSTSFFIALAVNATIAALRTHNGFDRKAPTGRHLISLGWSA